MDKSPIVGSLNLFWGYGHFFAKAVVEMGPNLFLVEYTKDKKGRSQIIYRALMRWVDKSATYGPNDEGFAAFGVVKQNRMRGGIHSTALSYYTSSLHNDWADSERGEIFFPNTDEGRNRATAALIGITTALYPELFNDRYPDVQRTLQALDH
jgi:hypothetical protein